MFCCDLVDGCPYKLSKGCKTECGFSYDFENEKWEIEDLFEDLELELVEEEDPA